MLRLYQYAGTLYSGMYCDKYHYSGIVSSGHV
jgi:hypothetical protein